MDEAENLLWLGTHQTSDPGWREHYEVLVESVAREKGIDKEDARKYADREVERHREAGGNPPDAR